MSKFSLGSSLARAFSCEHKAIFNSAEENYFRNNSSIKTVINPERERAH